MTANIIDVTGSQRNGEKTAKPRALSPRVLELIKERDGLLPVWVRAPVSGQEHYTGFTRAKLYELHRCFGNSLAVRMDGRIAPAKS